MHRTSWNGRKVNLVMWALSVHTNRYCMCRQFNITFYTTHPIYATGRHILLHIYAHTHPWTVCIAAAFATSSNNGWHCHFFLSTHTPLKWSTALTGAIEKTEERKKAILLGLVVCTNGEHGSSSNSRTLEHVCALFIKWRPPYVQHCALTFVWVLNQTVEDSL